MQTPNVFFPKLKETRIHRGYTQKDMQLLLEYRSESRYAQYETGDRTPNVVEALRIANVLGETVEYLFSTLEGGDNHEDSGADEWRTS